MALDSLAMELKRDIWYDAEPSSVSASSRGPKEKPLKSTGELRSLSEDALATPNEKPGEGRGPGIGAEMLRDVTGYCWWSGREARTAWYGDSGEGEGDGGMR